MPLSLLLAELRQRWLEYVLAGAAVALVVAALVAQRAVAASADGRVHQLAHELGKNLLLVPATADVEAFHGHRYGAEGLHEGLREAIAASAVAPHVQGMQLRLYANVPAGGGEAILVGDDGFPPQLAAMEPPPAVLGGAVARRLRLSPGDGVEVSGGVFRVVQIADPAPDGLDEGIFVPLAAAQRVLGRPGEVSAARMSGCWCSIDVAALGTELEKIVPGSRAISVAGMLRAQTGSVDVMKRYAALTYSAGAALVALLIAALVAAQARRRTRELGLLVAIGATPGRVAAGFAAQAVALGVAAAALGWLLAIPATRWLGERVLGGALHPPAGLLGPAVLAAAIVSAVAAAVPALLAASKDPTQVLRENA